MVLEIKQNLINEFKGIIKDSFGDYLIYSFLTGSLNYKYYKDFINNSDVDLMIVLSNDIILSHELKKCRQKFNSYYLQLHTEYSLKPDLVFPGEVISEAMLEEVKLGRGFEKHSEKLFYREISGENEEWLLNHDLEYRCWRSMFFFTKNESFISGEYNKFLSDRNEIILPFIFYLLEYPQKPLPSDYNFLKIRIEQKIKNSCINEFGYCNSYESNLFGENSELIGIPIKEVLINSGILIKNTEKIDIEILEKKILKFLGSGCWQGVPGQFCDDEVSKNVKWNSKDFRFRTSLLIETKNKKTIIIEITPDIRLQAWKYNLKVPDVFLVSHWHWDHLFGLKDLDWFCEKNNPIVYGNKTTKQWYDRDMSYIPVNFKLFESYVPFIIDNIKITPFEVKHVEGTDGFIFEDLETGKKVAYFADLCGISKKSFDLVKNVETVIVDSFYIEGEGIFGDNTHFWGTELLNFLESLNSKNKILTHISSHHNLNHKKLQKKYSKYTIAHDGMEFKF